MGKDKSELFAQALNEAPSFDGFTISQTEEQHDAAMKEKAEEAMAATASVQTPAKTKKGGRKPVPPRKRISLYIPKELDKRLDEYISVHGEYRKNALICHIISCFLSSKKMEKVQQAKEVLRN